MSQVQLSAHDTQQPAEDGAGLLKDVTTRLPDISWDGTRWVRDPLPELRRSPRGHPGS